MFLGGIEFFELNGAFLFLRTLWFSLLTEEQISVALHTNNQFMSIDSFNFVIRWQNFSIQGSFDGLESIHLPFSKDWAPDLILHNSLEEKFIFRQLGLLKHTGQFVYIISVHTTSTCEPNFRNFPLGVQNCQLKFGSWINEQYQVEYRVGVNDTVALNDFASHTGWKVVATSSHLESKQYPLFEEPSNIVVFDFAFRKEPFYISQAERVRKVRILKVSLNTKCVVIKT